MAFVVVFACVLVCGLELFAVMRIRRLQEDNAALRQRLSAQAERIESGVLKIDERFGKERDETQEQYAHLDGRFNELHTDTQASPAAADDRIDRLRIDIAARLAQVEKGIPNLANSEEVIGLLSRVGTLEAANTAAAERLRDLVGQAVRRESLVDQALQRLHTVEQRVTAIDGLKVAHAELSESVAAVVERGRTLSGHVQRWRDAENARALGVDVRNKAIVHGALSVNASPVADVLPLLYTECVKASGGRVRFVHGEMKGRAISSHRRTRPSLSKHGWTPLNLSEGRGCEAVLSPMARPPARFEC